jgi:hypothetical protein
MTTQSPSRRILVPIADTELHHLNSAIVGQQYEIKVRLPERYDEGEESYPVLYLLDGDHIFAMATDIVQYLIYGNHIPDLIIISPAYGDKNTPEYGGSNMRNRDLSPFLIPDLDTPPGAAKYLQFFEQELMPFATSQFRIDSSDKTLAGWSLGAIFVLYALFEKPALFQRRIAFDIIAPQLLEMETAFAADNDTLPGKLFLASGDYDMTPLAEKMVSRNYTGLTIDHQQLSRDGHFSLGGEGLSKGLVSVFR